MKQLLLLVLILGLGSCFSPSLPPLPPAHTLSAPASVPGNGGKYMSPYTKYSTVTDWVSKAKDAGLAASFGASAGGFLGGQLLRQIPFIGGWFGNKVGNAMGREAAIAASGGWSTIKGTSDQSYNDLKTMAVHMYVNYSAHQDYPAALNAAYSVYPELKTEYYGAVLGAPRKSGPAGPGASPAWFKGDGGTASVPEGLLEGMAALDTAQIGASAGAMMNESFEKADLAALRDMSGVDVLHKFATEVDLKELTSAMVMMEQSQPGFMRAVNAEAVKHLDADKRVLLTAAYQRAADALPPLVSLAKSGTAAIDQGLAASQVKPKGAAVARQLAALTEAERHTLGEMILGYAGVKAAQ